jgi:hypothetical protein
MFGAKSGGLNEKGARRPLNVNAPVTLAGASRAGETPWALGQDEYYIFFADAVQGNFNSDLGTWTEVAAAPVPGAGLLSYIAVGILGLGSICWKRRLRTRITLRKTSPGTPNIFWVNFEVAASLPRTRRTLIGTSHNSQSIEGIDLFAEPLAEVRANDNSVECDGSASPDCGRLPT